MRNTFRNGLKDLEFEKFKNAFIKDNDGLEIIAQEARLIPIGNKDDEMALATVFLSSLTLIKEFKNIIHEQINLTKTGRIYCFTEVSFPRIFPDDDKKRFDGLLIVVSNGKIKNSVIFEMKSKSEKINKNQIECYLKMAEKLKVDKLVSISNQFVTTPTDYPEDIISKKVELYHLSWKLIQTLGEILFLNNDLNIADIDQQNIMKEILRYFKTCSGVQSFDKMNPAWKDVVQSLSSSQVIDTKLNEQYKSIIDDWTQEEKDLALKLSLKLSKQTYTPVICDNKESKIERYSKLIGDTRSLSSIFKIKNAISPLSLTLDLRLRKIIQEMSLTIPEESNAKKLTYARKFLLKAQKNNTEIFNNIQNDIIIILRIKGKKVDRIFNCNDFLDKDKTEVSKELQIKKIDIVMESDLGNKITQNTKIISFLEERVLEFYTIVMQYFENWKKPSPKIPKIETTEEIFNTTTELD